MQWAEWQSECANGGCGPNAVRLQGTAERTVTQIAALVRDRKAISSTPQISPDSSGYEFHAFALGSHRERPQLMAALDFLREDDTLVVWKLSRLARSLTQVIKTTADIGNRGIALKVLTQNIDTSTPEGRLFFHMTAAFDEFQRELIVENTRAGLVAAAERGRRGGRPKAMTEQTLKHVEAMLKDTENYPFVGNVIDQLQIGRTAFYRYFPPDRIKQLRNEHADTI